MEHRWMMSKNVFRFLLFITMAVQCFGDASDDPDAATCFGTSSGMSVGVDRVDHYSKMHKQYKGCKIVKGNLEITGLASPTLDVSFLQDIEVVTGYVAIALNYVPYLPIEKLKIIRGRELFRGKYALYVTVNYNSEDPQQCLRELRLSSLTEIVRGSVNFHGNRLCYVNSINWNDILNPASRITGNYTADISNTAPASCEKCHSSCSGGCWGSEPSMCQTLTHEICASDCGNSRCRGPTRDDCCNDECAAGCTGPTNRDCLVCMHVNNSGMCQTSCPPARIYDPQSQRNIPNPLFKYHYSDRCVDKCPSNLLVEDNGCVKSCRVGYHNDGNEKCVQCKGGVCDKECFGVKHQDGPLDGESSVTSLNIHHFEGCNIIKGNLIFQTYAFVGDDHKKIPPMNLTQMNALRDIKAVTGYIHIVSWHENLTDFSIFGNLQRIGGVERLRNLVALVIQDSIHKGPYYLNQITSLGLRSLKGIHHGNVYIGYMKNLCYDRLVNWTSIVLHPVAYNTFDHGVLLRRNGVDKNCTNVKCDAQCATGCWGPGPRQCQKCRHFSYNGTCIAECSHVKGIGLYLYSVEGVTECLPCHAECNKACFGPGAGNCTYCQHFRNNGDCVVECPNDKYGDRLTGECLPCNSTCVVNGDKPLCSGPNATLESGGCNFCETIVTTRTLDVVRCLPVGSECPDAHFSHEGDRFNSAKHTCVPCYEGCYNCSGLAKSNCLHSIESADQPWIIALTVSLLIATIIAVGLICICCRHREQQIRKKRQRSMRVLGIDPNSPEEQCIDPRARLMEPMTPSGVAPNQAQLRIVKEAELRIGKILGSGAFGTVHKGYWIPDLAPKERVKVPVAIKVLREDSSQVASNEILDEAFVMASCEHPNLVRLLGISLSQKIMLITQLMPLGNLLEYVRDNKDNIGSQHLLNWCLQIAKGMRYLAEEKHLVHRDLAARNVLVKSPNHVRITDFGLAKLLDVNEDVYRADGGKMPIKWLALESIQHRIFTQKSDVWSFGVTMWELMTFGKKPYENVPAREVHTLLEKGERLLQPHICTINIYMLLIKCWTVDAEARPTFRELAEDLSKMARDPQRYIVVDNEGMLDALPSPTTSEFLRSLKNEEGDDFPITDAEEYLHPQAMDGADGAMSDNQFALQPAPSMVPWKRQHNEPFSSTSSQQALLEARASGRFQNRMDNGRFGQPSQQNDRRLDSVMTTTTNLSSISSSMPIGSSTPFNMPMSPDLSEEEVLLGPDGVPIRSSQYVPRHLGVGDPNSARTFSDSSDVFGPPSSKNAGEGCDVATQPNSRLGRAREDSTTMRYSAEPVALCRQQTKPNEYLDPSEFPPSPFALKPPVNITDIALSSVSNPEYDSNFVPTDKKQHQDCEGYEIPITQEDNTEYQNVETEKGLKLETPYSLRHSSQSGDSIGSEKRDSGMQSDDEGEKKRTAVANPNYDYLGMDKSGLLGQSGPGQPEYVNTANNNNMHFTDDDIFSIIDKRNKPELCKDNLSGRTYSEPDSGVGIEMAVDNMLYHKLGGTS